MEINGRWVLNQRYGMRRKENENVDHACKNIVASIYVFLCQLNTLVQYNKLFSLKLELEALCLLILYIFEMLSVLPHELDMMSYTYIVLGTF